MKHRGGAWKAVSGVGAGNGRRRSDPEVTPDEVEEAKSRIRESWDSETRRKRERGNEADQGPSPPGVREYATQWQPYDHDGEFLGRIVVRRVS